MHNNYGDLTLHLPPTWNRLGEADQQFALQMVGHENGVSDAYLKDEPTQRHQFAWVDPKYREDETMNVYKGYRFVKKDDGWVINERLWAWDAEGFCTFKTFKLMARTEDLFLKDMEARRIQRNKVMGKTEEDDAKQAAALGIDITGDDGKRVKAGRRRGMTT